MTRWLDLLRRSPAARVVLVLAAYVGLAALGRVGSFGDAELWHPAAGAGVAVVAIVGRAMIPVVMVGHLLAAIVTGDAIGRDVYLTVLDAVLVGGAYAAVGLVLRDRPVRPMARATDVAILLGVLVLGSAPAALAGTAVDRIAGVLGPDHVDATVARFQADALGMLTVVPLALAVAASIPVWSGRLPSAPRLDEAVRRSDDVVAVVSLSGAVQWCNRAGERYFAPSARGLGSSVDDVFAAGGDRTRRLARRMAEGRTWTGDEVLVTADGEEVLLSLTVVPDVAAGRTVGYTLFGREPGDAGGTSTPPQQLLRDQLTGLPSHTLLVERIAHAGARRLTTPGQSVVLLLDVDRFSVVNDSLGRDGGDELLRSIAARVQTRLVASDTLGRLHADAFVVVVEDLDGINAVMHRADDVLESLRAPFTVSDSTVMVSASIGIVRIDPEDPAEEILRRAEIAVHRAKAQGGSRWVLYDDRLARSADRRLRVESWIRRAVLEDAVPLRFRPVVDLRAGHTPLAEAVLHTGDGGLDDVPAAELLSVAASAGLLGDLARGTILGAATAAASWPESVAVAVPLTWDQAGQAQVIGGISETLGRAGLSPDRLVLSFAADSGLQEPALLGALVEQCRDRGVRTALELGAGAAPLATLRTVPVDILVLDPAMLDGLNGSPRARAVVGAVLGIAEVLDLTVVAGGIATEQQLEVARSLGCHLGHGDRISAPLPADAMAPWAAGRS